MRKKKEPPKPMPHEAFKKSIETFNDYAINSAMSNCISDKPSSFNSNVQVRKYKITVEMIEEPIEIIQERIINLWEECDNHHHWKPLKAMAERYNCLDKLTSESFGIKKPVRS